MCSLDRSRHGICRECCQYKRCCYYEDKWNETSEKLEMLETAWNKIRRSEWDRQLEKQRLEWEKQYLEWEKQHPDRDVEMISDGDVPF